MKNLIMLSFLSFLLLLSVCIPIDSYHQVTITNEQIQITQDVASFPSGVTILTLRPNALGFWAYNDWTADPAVDKWLNVDEVVSDDDATLIKTNRGGDAYQLFHLPNHTIETGIINSVTVYVRVKVASDYNAMFIVVGTGINHNIYDGYFEPTTSWQTYSCIYTEGWDDDGNWNDPWTWDNIDALEIGIYADLWDLWDWVYCTQIWAEVEYQTATPDVVYVDDDYNAGTPGWGVDHFATIQNGINNVSIYGTVYVYAGSYTETVTIDKTLDLIGSGKDIVTLNGEVIITDDAVNINGIKILAGGFDGITLDTVEYCNIFECYVDGQDGIVLDTSDYNAIFDNEIRNNVYGIDLYQSSYNEIYENNITINSLGINVRTGSNDNIFTKNNLYVNTLNADDGYSNDWYDIIGNYWDDYTGNDEDSNGVGDTPYHVSGGSNYDDFPLMHPWNGTMPELKTVLNVNTGLRYSHIQDAIDNASTGNFLQIEPRLYYEHIVIDKTLTINGSNMDTVIIDGDGSGNLVTVTANNVVFKNIYMRDANRLMYLDGCDTLYVTRCRFSDGADLEGIRFDDANYCTFYENNFSYNADVIIEDATTGNLFYHNNFYMGCNAVEEGESGNHWNATYPVGGNYWHDHWYPYDVYSGPDQDIPGSDGIWDKPMDVGRGNKDYYPLAIPIEFGKNPPDILTPSPSNAQQNILVTFNQVRVYIEDPEGNLFDWTIQGKYIQSSGATGATAGWKTANIIGTLPYYQDVIWYVNATDSESNSVHAVYYFTTEIYEESDTNYVDDSYTSSDPEWHKSKWGSIQDAIDTLEVGGTIFIHAGTYYENILVDKSCNLIGSDKTTTTIIGDCGEDRGYVDMTIEVSALPYPDNGPVSHVNISNLRIENEIVGFYHSNCLSLSYLSYGDVYNCDFEYGWEGLAVNPRSNNITIRACSFTHFEQSGVVILGDDISITGCNLIDLSVRGIMLDHTAERNLIQGNYIEDCSYGIDVHQATDTIIIENVLKDNDRGMTAYAIYISNSEDTIIYHNNFYGNSINAFDNSIGSKWNSSYPSGGNYYDDWDEVVEGCYDRYQGPNQDLPGMDGIVDSNSPNPYLIAGGANKDNYPFIYPYTQVDCQGADFTWTPKYPNPKKEVFFSETSCTMTKIVKWTWVYGDGRQFESIKTSESTHVYAKEGWYTVKLIIQDNRGEIYTSAKKIYVGNAPHLFPIPPSKYPGFTVPEMYMLLHATDLPNSNEQVTVMVIDSGIIPQKYNDIDLSKIQQLGSLSYSSVTDENGHGTWVNYAVAYLLQTKLPNSKQISYKVFDAEGGSTSDVFLTALKKAKELHPDIVSISAGIIGGSPDDPFSQACEELRREGIIVIVAGGNFGPAANTIASPGCSDSVIAVAGSDPLITDNTLWERSNSVKANLLKTSILDLTDDIICTWSSRGPVPNMIKPDITSPGESIIGPWLRGEKCVSGTSMATPLISGGTALIVAQNKGLIDLVKNLYFWDKSVIPQTFEDAIESSCYVKEDVNAWGAGIAQFDKINGNFQMGLYSRLIIWFAFPLILIIIIIILLYYYYREHRKGYTSYKLPKIGKSYKLPKIRKSYKIPKLIKR